MYIFHFRNTSSVSEHSAEGCNDQPTISKDAVPQPSPVDIDTFTDGPNQPRGFDFPSKKLGQYERAFQAHWFDMYKWLHYDELTDSAFCYTCMKAKRVGAVSSTKMDEAFTRAGFSNWKKALEKGKGFSKHESSSSHKEATERLITAPQTSRGDISELLCEQQADIKKQNRSALRKIIQSILYLARQALPLRGNWDKTAGAEVDSNYYQLLVLRGEDDKNLSSWLTSDSKNKYTSPEIQNEMLEISALEVLRTIAKNIQTAKIYSIMADETSDVSSVEQLVICIRWVDEKLIAHEDFIGIHPLKSTKADEIVAVIKDVLLRFSLPIDNARGQCYDGASTMAGVRSGVATQIKSINGKCLYTHCYGHALNLAVGDVIKKVPLLKKTFGTSFELCKLVAKSPKRNTKLKDLRTESENTSKTVHTFCPTRWTVRGDSLESILENYEELMNLWEWSLEYVDDAEMSARIEGVRTVMKTYDFIFGCCLGKLILKQTDNLSRTLQNPALSAAQGQEVAKMVVDTLAKDRCEERYDLFWKSVIKIKDRLDVDEPILPRKRKIVDYLGMPGNAQNQHFHDAPKDKYKQIFFEVIDLAIACIKDRFDQKDFKIYVNIQETLIKAIQQKDWEDNVIAILNAFPGDFLENSLKTQLSLLPQVAARSKHIDVNNFTITDMITMFQQMDYAHRELLSEVVNLVKLMLVMPATNAVSERSFSALKRVKTYLRATMTDNRINHFLVLHAHKGLTDKLDIGKVADEFVNRNEMRKTKFGTFQ